MSGLLALLDDVAGIAKVAASSIDDILRQATKVGVKAAGAVIDDAAVTPKYLQGFSADRELPIIWRIAKGSFKNKLLYLLPIGLVLSNFAPWAIAPLLMLGGAYLCFEGAEKISNVLGWGHGHADYSDRVIEQEDSTHIEERKARGAIKTDFILSAEIMTIALASIPESNFWMEAATLATVAIMITVAVYGSVAIIVKADDVGLAMATSGRLRLIRTAGRGIVKTMPLFMHFLTIIGTCAMLWVGGSIIIHGLEQVGFDWPSHTIHQIALNISQIVPEINGTVQWSTTAMIDGILGLVLGFVLIPVGEKIITPFWRFITGAGN